jgi:hypothetical protein
VFRQSGHPEILKNSAKFVRASKLFVWKYIKFDRLCGIVVRVPGYRSIGLGSISCTTRLSEK